MSAIAERKTSHLELCAHHDVEHRAGTLLSEVHLLHDALPEARTADVHLGLELFGRRLQAPILISGMTGGSAEGGRVNRELATAAQKSGVGMGVGSQRAMLVDSAWSDSYRVREVAPDILLLANLGAVQARDAGFARVRGLVAEIAADALCIHLNPAQELVQDEGDRDFRGCLEAIAELSASLDVPVLVKETGCGVSPRVAERLAAAGVRWVDVSGAGGTSWTAVEALRGSPRQRAIGSALREWGIPTAASVVFARRAGLRVVASGGIRDAHDAARALALGASAVSAALPFLRAAERGGAAEVALTLERWIEALCALTLLSGGRRLADWALAPRIVGPQLRAWIG